MRSASSRATVTGWLRLRLPRVIVVAAVAGLVLFHLRLLWQRVSDLSVLDPWVAAKWLASGLIVLALWRLRSAGVRLISGKRAGVIWLLALLLHVQFPAMPPAAAPLGAELESVGWLLALPAGVSMGAALALLLGLALAAAARAASAPRTARARPRPLRLGAPLAGVLPALSSRPPPHLS